MKKHIYEESNRLSYTMHGDYYLPDLVVNEEEPTYGKYGMLRKQFLKVHRPARYQYLLMTGELTAHLNRVDQEAREQVKIMLKQMAEKQGVTEQMKIANYAQTECQFRYCGTAIPFLTVRSTAR